MGSPKVAPREPLNTMIEFPTNPELRRLSREEKTELNERIDKEVETYLEKVLGHDLYSWLKRTESADAANRPAGHGCDQSGEVQEDV
jgi:hypothetical protein